MRKFRTFFVVVFFLPLFTIAGSAKIIDSLKQLLATELVDTSRVNIYNLIADKYKGNEPAKAIQYADSALTHSSKINFKRGEALALNLTGTIHQNQGRYPKALDFLLRSLKVYEQIGNKYGQAIVYTNIGILHKDQRQYDKAIEYYMLSLKLKEESGNKKGLAITYINVGAVKEAQKNYPEAREFYFKALKLFEEQGHKKGTSSALNNIGNTYYWRAQYPEALEYYMRARTLKEELNDKNGLVNSYVNIGSVLTKQKNFIKAIESYQQALGLATELNDNEGLKNVYSEIGVAYAEMKNFEKAFYYEQLLNEIKDTLYSNESTRQIQEMEVKYDTQKKESEIELLNKDKLLSDTEAKRQKAIKYFLLGVVLLVLLLALVGYRAYVTKRKANAELVTLNSEIRYQKKQVEEQKERVEEQKQEIMDSINYARRIQDAILPPDAEFRDTFPNSFVLYKPKDVVSGDFYWTAAASNRKVLAVADCTGHGVPGAFMSLIGYENLKEVCSKYNRPGTALKYLNRQLKLSLRQETTSTRDGMDIALCMFESSSSKVYYSGANRPLYLIRNNELHEYTATKAAIGGLTPDEKEFETIEIELQPGDEIVLSTDGFADQFGGEKGKKFMTKNFKNLLLSVATDAPEQQKTTLTHTIDTWRGKLDQVDDILVIGVKI